MNHKYLLGIDIGTTGTKILLIDNAGGIIAEVNKTATLISLQSNWAEEDPLEWWENVCVGIPECLKLGNVDSANIVGIGVSGMVPTTILVDKNGKPLRRSIQQNDARSFIEIDELRPVWMKDVLYVQGPHRRMFQSTPARERATIGCLLWFP